MAQERVVLITGGTRGIGKAIAKKFCEPNTHLILTYLNDINSAEQTQHELSPSCASVSTYAVNMQVTEEIQQFFQDLSKSFEHLDILINNAASGVFRDAAALKVKHWDYTVDVCQRGPWWVSVCARELLKKAPKGGKIVNVSSLGAGRVLKHYTAIGMSKAAIESLTRYLAIEFMEDQIAVNCVSAPTVVTEALMSYPEKQKMIDVTLDRTPIGRLVEPNDLAEVAYFLTTPGAQMIRGQVIVVDGGFSVL